MRGIQHTVSKPYRSGKNVSVEVAVTNEGIVAGFRSAISMSVDIASSVSIYDGDTLIGFDLTTVDGKSASIRFGDLS